MSNFGAADEVTNYRDLANYLRLAADDLVQDPEDWENVKLEDFLRAWSAWLDDRSGYYANRGEPVPDQPTWSQIAVMVRAAKVYE